ncbi:hypothetical protein A4U64_27025 (plasmid) [Rhodococcus sp. WB1]|uniref:hypothetical protein n=1 Tax=Rhodococcus sp. WB1 TaxID=1033922 RepID=UPI00081A7C25|nr:hypothetical protein [Rhodococcus sp. WB1]ANZ28537.1 hypothetical protein A4U64_27025 [Rhodococcus sp. WB1]
MTERYGPEPTASDERETGSVHFPIPEETIDSATVEAVELEPVDAASAPDSSGADDDAVIQTDLEPIVEADTAILAAPAAAQDPYISADHDAPAATGYADPAAHHDDPASAEDPYATAPEWVRAHIPRGPLVMPERTRGGIKSALGRARPARPAPAQPVDETAAVVVTDTTPAAATVRPDRSRTWMLVGGGVAVLAVVSAVVVTAMTGTTDEPQVPPLPSPTVVSSSTTTTSTTASATPGWCAPVTESDRVVGNGPGGRDSGPAVIQAFEYAYYVERDGTAVADLMVLPGTEIQSFIDAVPVGTEHCVSVLPTEDPNRWSVDVLLKFPPVGDEGIHKQWITTLPADGGLKIANVENR